jgi:hypothetical protein
MNYTLLIIDNEDQSDAIEAIHEKVKDKNFTIECFQFNVGLPAGGNVINTASGKIKKSLIISEYNKKYGSRRFDMVAFDYNLEDENIFGIDVIKTFNGLPKTSRSKKIMYSAELTSVVQEQLEKYKEGSPYDPVWNKFKTLIQIEIMDFCEREHYEDKIIDLISKTEPDKTMNLIIKLRASSDLSFNNTIHTYSDKNFGEIADLIEMNDPLSEKFLNEYYELSLAILKI